MLTVRGESKIAGSEYTGLGILDVHIVYTGKIAYTAGYHYETLVFDGAGMGTHLYAAVSILRIGKKRHKEYLHALVRHDAAQFRELYIVAYQYAYLGTVRIESLDGLAAAQSPRLYFIGSDVYLLIHFIAPVASAKESYIV